MTPQAFSKFWRDVADAYTQVAQRHDREIMIVSDAEDLTAKLFYVTVSEEVVIEVSVGSKANTGVHQRLESEA